MQVSIPLTVTWDLRNLSIKATNIQTAQQMIGGFQDGEPLRIKL